MSTDCESSDSSGDSMDAQEANKMSLTCCFSRFRSSSNSTVDSKGNAECMLCFLLNLEQATEVTRVEIYNTRLKNRYSRIIALYENRLGWFTTLSFTIVVFIILHFQNHAEESMRWYVLLGWFLFSIIPTFWPIVKRRTSVMFHHILKLTYMIGDEEHVNLAEFGKDGLRVYFPEKTAFPGKIVEENAEDDTREHGEGKSQDHILTPGHAEDKAQDDILTAEHAEENLEDDTTPQDAEESRAHDSPSPI